MPPSTRPPSKHSGPPPDALASLRPGRDKTPGRLVQLGEFQLQDLEAVRLVLRGRSIIDWHRLDFESEAQARKLIENHELSLESESDRQFMEQIQSEAVAYLRRNFSFAIPRPVERAPLLEL